MSAADDEARAATYEFTGRRPVRRRLLRLRAAIRRWVYDVR